MTMAYSPSDYPLLADAESVLAGASFAMRREWLADEDTPWLLAENEFFLIAAVATDTLEDAYRAEAFGAAELLNRISATRVGAKRWDAYLVILAKELVDDPASTRQLAEMQYDTRGVRRLVATGIVDLATVTQALRPFLPLPEPVAGGLSDALADLRDQLSLNGIAESNAERYVAAFSETGDLDDV
jgi:hypothetical protein